MRTALRNFFFLTLPPAAIVVLVLETLLRFHGYVPYYLDGNAFVASQNPRIVYELRPRFRGLYAGVPTSINSRGVRGREPTKDGADLVTRIAVVGDSVAFGQGVRDDETLSVQLTKALERRAHPGVEVANLGVPAYNTCQEYWRFKDRGLEPKPQVVVLVYVSNDTDPPTLQVIGNRVISPDVKIC